MNDYLKEYREHLTSLVHPPTVNWEDYYKSRGWISADLDSGNILTVATAQETPHQKLQSLKKSIRSIEAEPFDGETIKRIEAKISRLHKAGAVAQSAILEQELTTRNSLIRLKEWDYRILTKEVIEKFQSANMMTWTQDGLKIHIDPLDKYYGNPQAGEAKDRIIPNSVLDKLEEAQERELFDELHVLWAERVKDPLLLGSVTGCEDYFFICEWGDDITFEQITKGE